MIVFIIGSLLLAEGVRQEVSGLPVATNEIASLNGLNAGTVHEREDNSMLNELPGRGTRPSSLRSRRDAAEWKSPNSTEASTIGIAYEREMNRTIMDYYAQRKAVMDRYYARQRAIVEKFSRRNNTLLRAGTSNNAPTVGTSGSRGDASHVANIIYETREEDSGKKLSEEDGFVTVANVNGTNQPENRNSSVSWIYRSGNWNPREIDNLSNIDLLTPKSSNVLERSVVDNARSPGYFKLGEFRDRKDEYLVYQHHLQVGLKGKSQLDATFEAVLGGSFAITVVEAFPVANTRANLSQIDGGPGWDFVKLRIKGYENEGFSCIFKVWAIPKDIS